MVSPESYFSQDMFLLHWNVGGSVGTTLLQARAESAREDGRLASLAVCHHRERLSGESVKTCEQPEPNLCISHLFCVSFGLFHVIFCCDSRRKSKKRSRSKRRSRSRVGPQS